MSDRYRLYLESLLVGEPHADELTERFMRRVPEDVFFKVIEAATSAPAGTIDAVCHWLYGHFYSIGALEAILDGRYVIIGFEAAGHFPALAHPESSNLRSMPYADYLATEHWQAMRVEALERAGNRCQLCNSSVLLEVHHRTYERRGRECPEDLVVLCRSCHSKFHGQRP